MNGDSKNEFKPVTIDLDTSGTYCSVSTRVQFSLRLLLIVRLHSERWRFLALNSAGFQYFWRRFDMFLTFLSPVCVGLNDSYIIFNAQIYYRLRCYLLSTNLLSIVLSSAIGMCRKQETLDLRTGYWKRREKNNALSMISK